MPFCSPLETRKSLVDWQHETAEVPLVSAALTEVAQLDDGRIVAFGCCLDAGESSELLYTVPVSMIVTPRCRYFMGGVHSHDNLNDIFYGSFDEDGELL